MEKLFAAQREFGGQLGTEGVHGVLDSIERSNWRRIRIFFALTMLYELLLVLMVDLPALAVAKSGTLLTGPGAPTGTGEAPSLPLAYIVCHLGIFLTSGIGLLVAFLSLSRQEGQRPAVRGLFATPTLAPGFFATIVLMFLGVIAGLDQFRSGDISAFTINIIVASLLLYLRPPLGFLVFTPGFLLMIAGVFLFQHDTSLRLAHLVNGGIFYSAVLLLSAYLFNNHFRQLAKSILLERATEKINDLSLHDELTGLSNRRDFLAIVDRELSRMKREGRRAFLAVADIDHFKLLNDRYGHPAGDAVLRAVAGTLGGVTRATDAVARWGGEEFIILLEDGDGTTAREVLERARNSVEKARIEHEGRTLGCTLSFGFTEIDAAEADSFSKAYHRADSLLYAAKEGGRNRVAGPDLE